jgi:hypothetical protein
MERGRAIGTMVVAIVALVGISLFVLSDLPSETEDSTEQLMTYLSLMLFVMALVLIGALAVVVSRREVEPLRPKSKAKSAPEKADDDDYELDELNDYDNPDDGASDIELEFRALEREIERDEMS